MFRKEGFWGEIPQITSVAFPKRGKFQVGFKDGRIVIMPTSAFPCLRKVRTNERKDWYLIGNGITWDSCPEVIHVEQILGDYHKNSHEV